MIPGTGALNDHMYAVLTSPSGITKRTSSLSRLSGAITRSTEDFNNFHINNICNKHSSHICNPLSNLCWLRLDSCIQVNRPLGISLICMSCGNIGHPVRSVCRPALSGSHTPNNNQTRAFWWQLQGLLLKMGMWLCAVMKCRRVNRWICRPAHMWRRCLCRPGEPLI